MARILNDHGIFIFEQLAVTEVSFLEGLMAKRERYMADPNIKREDNPVNNQIN
jgi:hypothetical protein